MPTGLASEMGQRQPVLSPEVTSRPPWDVIGPGRWEDDDVERTRAGGQGQPAGGMSVLFVAQMKWQRGGALWGVLVAQGSAVGQAPARHP